MRDSNDMELVGEFARHHADAAFAELVQRHVNLVYSVALRHIANAAQAEEITQTVFVTLARKAAGLPPDTVLAAWLYETARLTAISFIRGERRRQFREQEAYMQSTLEATSTDPSWQQLAPLLDDGMMWLGRKDREAVVLRFFKDKDLREVAAALNINEAAAQKRVQRAVEKLRTFFTRRGVVLPAAALTTAISANAVQAAPVGLAVTISTAAALTGTTIAATATTTTVKAIAMTTLQKTLVTATVAVLAGAGIYQARQASHLRQEVRTIQQQQAPLAEEIQGLQREREEAARQLAALREDNERLSRNSAELLKLRSEIGLLRKRVANDSATAAQPINPYGLTPEQMPPVTGSVAETASAYSALVQKLATGQLTPIEQWHLEKAWPYLGRRFSMPAEFAHFQSEYLAAMLTITNKDTVWSLRKLLENAKDEERDNPKLYFGARLSDEEVRSLRLASSIQMIREQWGNLERKTAQQISELLTDEQRLKLSSEAYQVLDFDARLKVGLQPSLRASPIEGLAPSQVYQSFFTTKSNVLLLPARIENRP